MRCGVIAKFKPFDRTSLILVTFVFEKINNPPFYLCTTKIWFRKFIFTDFEIELASLSYCLHFACLCALSWTLVRCAFNCCWTSLGNRSAKRRFLSCKWLIFWFVSRILFWRRFFLAFSTMFLALSELIGHFKRRLGGMTHSPLHRKLKTKWFLLLASLRVVFSVFRTILMVYCP